MSTHTEGVGLQLNATMLFDLGLDALQGLPCDFSEVLCDMFAAPLDCGYVVDPAMRPLLEKLAARGPLIAHGNYGNEFGFSPLAETPGVLRHIALAHEMQSPWYADHMFYGARASSHMWSQPLQFSRAEVERVAGRAAAMQDQLKLPLLHENAFYYSAFPGSDINEADFIAGLVERAQTHLLLDLHNIYANSVNFAGYDRWQFLRTIPLDRVLEVHIAGGQWIEDYYHDLHNHAVPEPVWEMLTYVLQHAKNLRAVTLEVQGPMHTSRSRIVGPGWLPMVTADLTRAKQIWNAARAVQT